ncbi:MAG: SpoIIE family protein phosphatase [Polyangiaceae bacterium]|nr:SpoIIE family protein phosphatase [Polyangiaceae bacterium]
MSACPPFAAAHQTRPKAGETVCGDAAIVRTLGPSRMLFALFDALGHGPLAAHASAIALATLQACDDGVDLPALVDSLHEALRGSRGAAALVGLADGHALRACIVGNVELRVSRNACAGIIHSPGVLGVSVRKLRFFEGRVRPDDRLVAFSDGVSSRLAPSDLDGLGPVEACAYALERFGTPLDDASVLVLDALP